MVRSTVGNSLRLSTCRIDCFATLAFLKRVLKEYPYDSLDLLFQSSAFLIYCALIIELIYIPECVRLRSYIAVRTFIIVPAASATDVTAAVYSNIKYKSQDCRRSFGNLTVRATLRAFSLLVFALVPAAGIFLTSARIPSEIRFDIREVQ